MRALSIDPRNPDIMVAGSVSGGLWRSIDGGTSWTVVDDDLPSLAISAIVRENGDPDVLYASTGEPHLLLGFPGPLSGSEAAVLGAGVYRSTDNGVTWSQIPVLANQVEFGRV